MLLSVGVSGKGHSHVESTDLSSDLSCLNKPPWTIYVDHS